MPWNPMRVEQRIGRIDRLGQLFPVIQIINLHYADTIETDIYRALRNRIGLFQNVVGKLRLILAKLPSLISDTVLHGRTKPDEERQAIVAKLNAEADLTDRTGFDIDAVTEADLEEPVRPSSPITMADLDRVASIPSLLPPGIEIAPLGQREYRFQQPGLARDIRVSTDPGYYEENADTVELWSPGNPTFPKGTAEQMDEPINVATLGALLDQAQS